MKRFPAPIIIWILTLSLCAGLAACTWPEPKDGQDAPAAPISEVEPGMSAGERAAARLQQAEGGLMADGLRVPLPPPPPPPNS